MSVKRLILTSCTTKKLSRPAPARDFYNSPGHRYLIEGVDSIRETLGENAIDLNIFSAKHGLLNENDIVEPYDSDFGKVGKWEAIRRARENNTREQIIDKVRNYSIVFYCLGRRYFQALETPFYNDLCTEHFFLVGPVHTNLFKFTEEHTNYHHIPTGVKLATQLGVVAVDLKGFLFKKMGEHLKKTKDDFMTDHILNRMLLDPNVFMEFIDELIIDRENELKRQIRLF